MLVLLTKATMFLAFLVLGLLKRPAHRYLLSVYVETCRDRFRPKLVVSAAHPTLT